MGYIASASFNEEQPLFSFIKNNFIYLFTLGCDGSSLLHVGFSLAAASRGYFPVAEHRLDRALGSIPLKK